MTTKQGMFIAVLILLSGASGYVLGAFGQRDVSERAGMHQMPDGTLMASQPVGMHAEMAGMMATLSGKQGDALDEAFLSEMIVHHQGAIDMAEAVLERGVHPELKELARAIVDAQTKEIEQMKSWQMSWYGK